MPSLNNNEALFFELLKAGLWNKEVRLVPNRKVDFKEIFRLAEEQSVVGLVAAGLEKVKDEKLPQDVVLRFIGSSLQIEQRNKQMNVVLSKITKRLQSANIFHLVVKGQGVAQCYERPLLRTCGDIDLLLNEENYEKAKVNLFPIAYDIQSENKVSKHQALKICNIDVELHGGLPFPLSNKAQFVNETVVSDSLNNGGFSIWHTNDTDVCIPNPDNHIFLVFTHYLLHFFIEGVGLRQICDWCIMLWRYIDKLDLDLLALRLNKAGLMTEWQVFGALSVEYLGISAEAMPFYKERFKKQGFRTLKQVLKSGNFGHNKDLSYRKKYKGMTYKMVSLLRRFCDFMRKTAIFPIDAPKYFVNYVFGKMTHTH